MKTSSKMLFSAILMASTIMVFNSTSWINMWMGLEINLMSFIPMMSNPKNMFLSQSIMMYFLNQALASMLFMMLIMMDKNMIHLSEEKMKMLLSMTMMMKMGMPPFHMWMPETMNKMKWNMCFVMMTWQKMAPMTVLSMTMTNSKTFMYIMCLSAMTGAIGGINQTSTRKIMAYSSMNHISWMCMCMIMHKKSWMMYLLMYTLLMMNICMMMYKYNIMYINQTNIFLEKKMDKIIIIIMILSLSGIPPFLGFLPKWITIQYMIMNNEMMVMIIMMISTLITMTYYLRISFSMNLMMSHSQKWMLMMKTSKMTSIILFMTNLMLPLMILIMNMI